ncbi:TIR domain-containing protein [Pseudomonas phenolilytica]|uniref:TIR domain-containing protein n=1 Tax=Pseudomonas phenolilytica TaxID=2746321 RepID=UPI001F1C18D9|nr:TIR domain-containing protein [Pseudomonas phenolilytica]UIP85068.1 TIR domain-containing protein [Pseudomonas phenolilytica]
MANEGSIIFVSHAAADAEIAAQFKNDIEKSFLGLCKLFVSSNLDSLQGGREWMQEIKQNLSEAKIFIGLLSPLALNRPWIYTEFGAGWIRNIPTISVCHSGLDKGQLPIPLSHFQALNLTDKVHLEHLYGQISQAIGCQKPERALDYDVERYHTITESNRIQRLLRDWAAQISAWNPGFNKIFEGETVEILIPGEADSAFRNFKMEVERLGYIQVNPKGFSIGTSVGMQAMNWEITPGHNFKEFKEKVSNEG